MSTTAPLATAPTAPQDTDHRCDRCGMAAFARFTLPSGLDLLFCGHHAREYGPGLLASAAQAQPVTR